MSIGVERYCNGLPVPSDGEEQILALMHDLSLSESDSVSMPFVFSQIDQRCPYLQRFMELDIRQCAHEIAFTNIDEEMEFSEGVWTGYQFLIGNIEYLHFLRSGYSDFDTYLTNLVNTDEVATVALLNQTRFKRLKAVRLGEAELEHPKGDEDTSRDFALFDTEDYFLEARGLEKLFGSMLDKLEAVQADDTEEHPGITPEVKVFRAGFKHGVAQAIEMYVQLHEELTWKRLNNPQPRPRD